MTNTTHALQIARILRDHLLAKYEANPNPWTNRAVAAAQYETVDLIEHAEADAGAERLAVDDLARLVVGIGWDAFLAVEQTNRADAQPAATAAAGNLARRYGMDAEMVADVFYSVAYRAVSR